MKLDLQRAHSLWYWVKRDGTQNFIPAIISSCAVTEEEHQTHEPKIICSMGLWEQKHG
jgi:hypothetical protein